MWAKGEAPNISKIGIHSRFNTVSKPMYFTALCCSGPGRRWKVSLVNQTNNNDPTLNDVVVQLISGVQVGPGGSRWVQRMSSTQQMSCL